jgi:hypothetical protein
MTRKNRLLALYLPQYHPIPENDNWWGKGFTEWTNVGKAKPLFRGHNQPRVPTDLGYYDLRLANVREQQAEYARAAGIEGFCYWHYWFGNGRRLLETPLNENLKSGKPDFPFCLGWANHSWKAKTWSVRGTDELLIEQKYDGLVDYTEHFNALLDAFRDYRYMKINGKTIFMIWDPEDLPEPKEFIDCWQLLAKKNNLPEFHFIASTYRYDNHEALLSYGFDSISIDLLLKAFQDRNIISKAWHKLLKKATNRPKTMKYDQYVKYFLKHISYKDFIIPSVVSNFDHTPRSGRGLLALLDDSPQKYEAFLRNLFLEYSQHSKKDNIIILRSWNEWAEGNYLEPDILHGRGYLDAIRNALSDM